MSRTLFVLIALLTALGLVGLFLVNAIGDITTSYEEKRLETIAAQTDYQMFAAENAKAQAEAVEAEAIAKVLEASAYAVRVDATTVGIWTIVGPVATATLVGFCAIVIIAATIAQTGAVQWLAAWLETRKAEQEGEGDG